MQVDYKPFVDRMINKYEGGYCWDKGDPGGPTKYGITCFDLAEHRGQKMQSMTAWAPIVRAMPLEEAEAIYVKKYATAIMFNDLPAGVDCTMMDYAVNSGIGRPPRVANALFSLPQRSKMTPDLVAAIQKADPAWFIRSMDAERLAYMHRIRNGTAWETFGHGWQRRVDDLTTYALHVSAASKSPAGTKAPAPEADDLSRVPTPKARHEDPGLVKKAGTGTVGTTVTEVITAKSAGFPWWQIGVGAGVVVIAGVVYYLYREGKLAQANAKVILPPDIVPVKAMS